MKIPPWLVAPVAAGLYRVWNKTLRVTQKNRETVAGHEVVVFCMWHDEIFSAPLLRGDWKITAIVSRSRDGEYLSRLLHGAGLETARGSSSRGGIAALRQTARDMRERKRHACVTIDGPRGPRHEIKDGVFFLAHYAAAPLVPVRLFYERAKVFASWDRFQLPWPGSRVHLEFGAPYFLSAPGPDSGPVSGPVSELAPESLALERAILKEKLDGIPFPWTRI